MRLRAEVVELGLDRAFSLKDDAVSSQGHYRRMLGMHEKGSAVPCCSSGNGIRS